MSTLVTAAPASVVVAIPTYKRPDSLGRLLASLREQTVSPERAAVTAVVIDNDLAGSARNEVAAIAATFRYPLRYESEPRPGLSFVRNRALAYAVSLNVDYLAMVDDDQYAEPQWLAQLLEVRDITGADAVIGRVPQILPDRVPQWSAHPEFFELPMMPNCAPMTDGYSGNCLIDLRTVKRLELSFDADCNFAGGEDQLFFRQLIARGGSIRHAAYAVTPELVPAQRVSVAFLMKRSVRRGASLWTCDAKIYGTRSRLAFRIAKATARIGRGLLLAVPRVLREGRCGAVRSLCDVSHGVGTLLTAVGIANRHYAYGRDQRPLP